MTKQMLEREMTYRVAVRLAADLLSQGIITEKEYDKVETMLVEKFAPVWGAIDRVDNTN